MLTLPITTPRCSIGTRVRIEVISSGTSSRSDARTTGGKQHPNPGAKPAQVPAQNSDIAMMKTWHEALRMKPVGNDDRHRA